MYDISLTINYLVIGMLDINIHFMSYLIVRVSDFNLSSCNTIHLNLTIDYHYCTLEVFYILKTIKNINCWLQILSINSLSTVCVTRRSLWVWEKYFVIFYLPNSKEYTHIEVLLECACEGGGH